MRIKARLTDMLVGHPVPPTPPDGARQGRRHIVGEAQRLTHLTDRHARAIVDDGGDNGRAVTAIAAIDILHHLFAPLVLEIHIDIRRLAAFLGNEAREQ